MIWLVCQVISYNTYRVGLSSGAAACVQADIDVE